MVWVLWFVLRGSVIPCSCQLFHSVILHNTNMEKKPTQRLRLDELLPIIGEFGRFQITFDIALCILQAPGIMLIFLPYFSQHNPPWKCVANSSTCLLNGTFSLASKSYEARCQMSRSEWEYTEAKEYSVVTQVRVFKANFSDHIPNFLRSDSNKMSQEISGNAKLLMQLYWVGYIRERFHVTLNSREALCSVVSIMLQAIYVCMYVSNRLSSKPTKRQEGWQKTGKITFGIICEWIHPNRMWF